MARPKLSDEDRKAQDIFNSNKARATYKATKTIVTANQVAFDKEFAKEMKALGYEQKAERVTNWVANPPAAPTE